MENTPLYPYHAECPHPTSPLARYSRSIRNGLLPLLTFVGTISLAACASEPKIKPRPPMEAPSSHPHRRQDGDPIVIIERNLGTSIPVEDPRRTTIVALDDTPDCPALYSNLRRHVNLITETSVYDNADEIEREARINSLSAQLFGKYGICIHMGMAPFSDNKTLTEIAERGLQGDIPSSAEDIENFLQELLKILERFPRPILDTLRNLKGIYLIENLSSQEAGRDELSSLGGLYAEKYIVFATNISSDVPFSQLISHEITHYLFKNSYGSEAEQDWSITPCDPLICFNSRDLIIASARALEDGTPIESWYPDRPAGCASMMCAAGQTEDQADISGRLLSPENRGALMQLVTDDTINLLTPSCTRFSSSGEEIEQISGCDFDPQTGKYTRLIPGDSFLGEKIRRLTGCDFDSQTGTFTRLIPEAEYTRRFGTNNEATGKQGYQFWSSWSRDPNTGEVLMGPDFWNGILDE